MPVNSDPYYFVRDIATIQNQRRAVGSGRSFSPEEITSLVGANFKAQQENEVTQQNLQLAKNSQAMQQQGIDISRQSAQDAAQEARVQGRRQAITGTTQLVLNAPLAYLGYKQALNWLGGGSTQAVTTGGTTAATGSTTLGGLDATAGSTGGINMTGSAAGAEGTQATTTGAAGTGTGSVMLQGAGGLAALAASRRGMIFAAESLNLPGDKYDWGKAGTVLPSITSTLLPLAIAHDIWNDVAPKLPDMPRVDLPSFSF